MQKSLKQQQIIDSKSNNILVSASAGCGKTTTMINRIVSLIANDRIELKNMLIVTYTNAAANDIKEKLYNLLKEKVSDDSFILKQLNYLDYADISTLHSFCSKVLKSYFYAVNLEPKFEVLEDNNAKCLKMKALLKILKDYYEKDDAVFSDLTEILSYNRNISLIPKLIIDLYEKSTCFVGKERFKDICLKACNADLNQNEIVKFVNNYIIEFSANCIVKLEELYKSALSKNHKACVLDCIEVLKCLDIRNSLKENLNVLNIITLPAIKPLCKEEKENAAIADFHDEFKNFKAQITKGLKSLKDSYPPFEDDKLINTLEVSKSLILKLLEIIEKFEKEYTIIKSENCALDFSDLEKYMVEILKDNDIKAELKNKFKYVFIDECQDINEVQDYIIGQLAPDNLFSVGDVKQCIYRFRGAKPEIFIDKCVNSSQESFFRLDENYRTNKQILDFTNDIFSALMFKEFSLVDYRDTEKLVGQNIGQLSDGLSPVVVDIVNKQNDCEGEDEDGAEETLPSGIYSVKNDKCVEEQAETEGLVIAKRISDLVRNRMEILNDEKYLKDNNRSKYITYNDICILVRGKKGYTEKIFETIKNAGIPISAEFKYSVREYQEIEELIQYLFLIDNFYQDIPLLSVLKSPFAGFTDRELSLIKLGNNKDFHLCFYEYASNGIDGQLKNKVSGFVEALIKYRNFASFNSVSDLLELIISENRYEAKLLETIDGTNKAGRVNSFIAGLYGKNYEQNLYTFIQFINNFSDEIKISGALNSGDCVKINTIHQSKGLEYPVVILAGNQNKFNFKSSAEIVPYHSEYGMSFKNYDLGARTVCDTVVHQSLGRAIKYQQIKEELNILYVAMTRARYRLYISSTIDIYKIKCAVTKFDIKNSTSPVELLSVYGKLKSGKNYDLFISNDQIETEQKTNKKLILQDKPVDVDLEKIINYKYAFCDRLNTPYKLSVTEASKSFKETENIYKTEKIFSDDSLTEKGNLYHKILQNINFNAKTIDDINKELERLEKEKIIPAKENVNTESIKNFLNSEILKNLDGALVYKERPFMISVPHSQIGGKSGDAVLVQGKIDLLFIKDSAATIIDYKVSLKDASYLLNKYKAQLEIYGSAVKKILNVKGIKLFIYSVLKGELIEI